MSTTSPAVDQEAITKKVTSLVEAYNAVVTFTRLELNEKKVPGAETSSDLQKGQLFGDSSMNGTLRQLKTQMTQTLSGLGLTGLGDLGIGIPQVHGADHPGRQGRQADARQHGKLSKAIAADYTKVRDLFTGVGRHQGLLGDAVGLRGHADRLQGTITGR